MVIFESENDLVKTIAEHDALVQRCVAGEISFVEFCETYSDFYPRFALDGHESDEEERSLLEKHDRLIEPHRVIAYEILGKLCADENSELESYKNAGRFGSAEALRKLAGVEFYP
jgi:hypothetical protein